MSGRAVENARARIEAIRAEIAAMELVSSGSLQKRMTRCGRKGCRCMTRDERHGPYFEWGRMQGGRQVSTFIPEGEAGRLRVAIAAHRRIRTLLRQWERESVRIIKHESAASVDQEGR